MKVSRARASAPPDAATRGATGLTLREEIWQWVAAIPPGKVATYGQIARLAGFPRHARYVGTTLKNLPKGSTLPWYRVLRGNGACAFAVGSPGYRRQRQLLGDEGVLLLDGKVALKRFQWEL